MERAPFPKPEDRAPSPEAKPVDPRPDRARLRAIEPRLPVLEDNPSWFGGQVVYRAVSVTLGSLATLAVLAVVLLLTLHMEITVEAPGALEPETVWQVYSPASGMVRESPVKTGEAVVAGQELAKLDGFQLESRLERLELEARLKSHGAPGDRSEREFLEHSIRTAREELQRLTVRCPGAGLVLTEDLDKLPGAWIEEGALLFEIGSAGRWKADLLVTENDIHRIWVGDRVRIKVPALATLESWTAEPFPGEITFIGSDLVPGISSGKAVYRVRALLAADHLTADQLASFKRGMSVEAKVITRSGLAIDLLVQYFKRRLQRGD